MTNISHFVAHVIFPLHNAGLDSTEHLEWSSERPESPDTSLLRLSSGFTHPSGPPGAPLGHSCRRLSKQSLAVCPLVLSLNDPFTVLVPIYT